MKKIIYLVRIVISFFVLSGIVNAEGLKSSFYMGVQGGYDSYHIRQTINDGFGNLFNPLLNPTGAVGGIFAGYGQYICNLGYIGTEIFGNLSSAKSSWSATTPGSSLTSSLRAKGAYGIHILPGIKINKCTLGYLRLGYNRAYFRANLTASDVDIGSFTTTKTAWKNGWAAGLGMEAGICQNWSVRLDYIYSYYQSFNHRLSDSRFAPSDNEALLGLVFHFV